MNILWLILAALSFVGSQTYLFYCLRKMDTFRDRKDDGSSLTFDESCRYPGDDVVE